MTAVLDGAQVAAEISGCAEVVVADEDAQIRAAARRALERLRGHWVQGITWEPDSPSPTLPDGSIDFDAAEWRPDPARGRVCLVGALSYAYSGYPDSPGEYWDDDDDADSPSEYLRLVQRVAEEIRRRRAYIDPTSDPVGVCSWWNDCSGRTEADVVSLLERVAGVT